VAEIGVIGEVPTGSRLSHFSHQDIRNLGEKRFGHFRIMKSETPIRREVSLWEPDVSIAENRIRKIGSPVGKCFSTFEPPKS
jgi:hypothetical protein